MSIFFYFFFWFFSRGTAARTAARGRTAANGCSVAAVRAERAVGLRDLPHQVEDVNVLREHDFPLRERT